MTIAEQALDEHRNSCTKVNGWVVLYNSRNTRALGALLSQPPDPPVLAERICFRFVRRLLGYGRVGHRPVRWVSGSLDLCTVFDSYDEAVAAANEIEHVRDLPPADKRIVKIKIKTTVELQEDRPVDVLDALAEV